ncbi:MAG: CPBP family intramembrane glutamic endopeptidase [Terriglobia bacterium]
MNPDPPAPPDAQGSDNAQEQIGIGRPHQPHPRGLVLRVFLNERELRSGWRLLVFVMLWVVLLVSLMVLAQRVFHLAPGAHHTQRLLLNEGFMLIAALLAAEIMALAERRSFADYALPWRRALGGKFWLGVVWGGVALTVLLLLIDYYHGFSFGPLATAGKKRLLLDASVWAAGFFVVAFFEEFFTRGYALYTLAEGMGFWPAAALLSAAFGALHLRNPGEDWTGALAAGLIGLFCCFTVRRTGTLWFAIGFHAMWDYAESFIFFVPDSGTTIARHLFNSALYGPAWLTGGAVGPEASIFVFAVIANLFVLFHLLYPKARFAAASAT